MIHAQGLGMDDLEALLNLMPMPVMLVEPLRTSTEVVVTLATWTRTFCP